MDCYKYPCLQLAIQNYNVHLNVPPSRVIQQLFLASVLISVLLSFTWMGFHFSLHFYVLHATSEVVRRHLDLPSILAGRKFYAAGASKLVCFLWWFLSSSFAHAQHALAPLFSDSTQQCAPHSGEIPQVLMVPGESWRCTLSSEQVTGSIRLGSAPFRYPCCPVQAIYMHSTAM